MNSIGRGVHLSRNYVHDYFNICLISGFRLICHARLSLNPIGCGNSSRPWNDSHRMRLKRMSPIGCGNSSRLAIKSGFYWKFPFSVIHLSDCEWTPLDAGIHLDTDARIDRSAFTWYSLENEPHWAREFISIMSWPLENHIESRFWSCFRILLKMLTDWKGWTHFGEIRSSSLHENESFGCDWSSSQQLTRISHFFS